MSLERELAKRDRLLAEKSARIRELEALLRVFHHCAQQGKCANCKYFRGNDGCGESIFERYDALELRGDA